MCNRVCLSCGKFICNRGNRAIRCKKCQISHRELQIKLNNQKNNSIIKSARASKERYAFFNALKNFTLEELQFLFGKKKHELADKSLTEKEKTELRTQLGIINNMYNLKSDSKELKYGNS